MLSFPVYRELHLRLFSFFPIVAAVPLRLSTRGISALASSHFSLSFLAASISFTSLFFRTLPFSACCNSFICDSYENNGGVYQLFPNWNFMLASKSVFARSCAFLVRSFHSFTKECSRTLLQPRRSALFLKTAGCVGTERQIRSSLFIRLVVFCLPAAARAAITTKLRRSCHIQWRIAQG